MMHIHAIRLRPGQDLKRELTRFAAEQALQAAFILTGVGSLERAAICYANHDKTTMIHAKLEIVSLSGTLSVHGANLHIAVSDGYGATFGGHLQDGSIIYTTAEIVIGEATALIFTRELDAKTGGAELVVTPRP
ncbi:MAG: PPC domain-containing DNA-binding protein [Chloroflexota bacterium]|nr:PPC domain-containing DNA-binding protein [Chloroflexota bacterium]